MTTTPTENQDDKSYISLSFATISVLAAVGLIILPMAVLVSNLLQP